jgi:transcription factor Dp-1
MNGDVNGVDLVGSQQAASMAAPQQVTAGSMAPEACGISGLVVTESELAHATEATRAADSAVAEALAVLARTRHEVQALTGLGPSSSNMSDGQAMDFPDMAGQAGQEDEHTSSGRRRGRPSSRPDQHHAALAAAAAAATAAAAAAAAGGHGAGGVTGKAGKGLRHFSMKVCEKVESKGTTSYNEVADELVAEMRGVTEDGTTYDEKNIRRRVYDAINVLMALDIIAKEKKAILWKGFPSNRGGGLGGINATQRLASEKAALTATVERKAEMLGQLIEQQRALKHLLQRNSSPAGAAASANGTALQLPFILVQAKPDATVEVHISQDMRDVQFDFYK